MLAIIITVNNSKPDHSLHPWTKEHKWCGHTNGQSGGPRGMVSPGHDGVTAKHLGCLTLAHLAMGTDVYWIQGMNASSLSKFLVSPGRDITYDLFVRTYHLLQPALEWFPFSPIFIQILLILYMFSLWVSPHFPCSCKPAVLPLSSLNSCQTCCLNQRSTFHICARGLRQQGLHVYTFPPTKRKVAPGRQESRGLLAGHTGLSPSDKSTKALL